MAWKAKDDHGINYNNANGVKKLMKGNDTKILLADQKLNGTNERHLWSLE